MRNLWAYVTPRGSEQEPNWTRGGIHQRYDLQRCLPPSVQENVWFHIRPALLTHIVFSSFIDLTRTKLSYLVTEVGAIGTQQARVKAIWSAWLWRVNWLARVATMRSWIHDVSWSRSSGEKKDRWLYFSSWVNLWFFSWYPNRDRPAMKRVSKWDQRYVYTICKKAYSPCRL